MTIRGVFTPIEQDSMLLIDRGVIGQIWPCFYSTTLITPALI